MSVQGPSPKVTGEGHTVGGSAAAPSGRPQAKAPNFALAWQFVSSLSAGAPPGPPGAAAQAAQAAQAAHAHRAAAHSPNVPRAGSPLVAPGVRSPRAVSPPAGKSPAPAPQACSPQVGRLGGTAPPNNRVQLGKAAPWNRMETSPRPNSPPHVIRIQSPLYKDSQSPRFLMKHPSHPQLHSASAHAPAGGIHPVRWSGGTTQVSPRLRTSSPPPQQSPQQPPQPRQSHLLPVALANSVAAAAAAAHAAGYSQEHEMPGMHPPSGHPVPLAQHGPPGQPGQPGPCGPPHQPGQPGQAMMQVQQMQQQMQQKVQMQVPQVPHPQIQKQMQLQQMQMQQFQQLHSQPGQSGQVHLTPPMLTDPLQTQPLDASSVIRKPSSDITQVPSRRASNATLSPTQSPLLTTRAVATVHSPYAAEGKSASPTQLLWALHVEAASQSLLHQWEARCELPVTQRVGLLFQKDFFTSILSEEEVSMVDREQFQIWAVDSNGSDRSCSFFLTNFSSNGTMVNNQLLCIGGEQVPLKDGDRIALLRERGAGMETLLEFRFDLSGSILKDLAAWLLPSRLAPRPSALPTLASIPSSVAEPSPPTPREAMPQPELFSAEKQEDPEDEASPRPSAEGVSFLGVRPLPLFSLELGGQGLHDDVREEDLKIIHGPVAPKNEGGPVPGSCLPLLLGRSAQRSFWQRILVSNAFYAMSRQHLQFEVGEEFSVSSSATFHVRNLSSSNPVRICRTTLQEEMQAAVPLEMGEKRQLQDRDVIVLNPVQGYSFWLIFSDLWAKRTDAPENGANAADSKWIAFASAKTADCECDKAD